MSEATNPLAKEPSVHVDLWFPITGRTLPSDHGYALYGALCRVVPEMHKAPWWGLHTVWGIPGQPGTIALRRGARLGLRLSPDYIPTVLKLAGRALDLGGERVRIGAPTIESLAPAPALSARITTLKSFLEPEPFRQACERLLGADPLTFVTGKRVTLGPRKVVTIANRRVVGFSVRVSGLSPDESIRLQEQGLGGRRHMGCGIFRPSERDLTPDIRPSPTVRPSLTDEGSTVGVSPRGEP